MAGFDFQMVKAIGSIVRQHLGGGGVTLVEALSDIVEVDEGIVITQAKRTLSSSSFQSALVELWDIDRLAREQAPELAPHLRYQVLSARRVLQDWKASLDRWMPEGADISALAVFKARLSVAESPCPRLEAARLLVQGFKDVSPFDRIDRLLGRLVGASASTIDGVIREFRVDLDGLAEAGRQLELRFNLWGAEDRPPTAIRRETDARRAVRLGERLTIADLREGRLGDRSVYNRIERHCTAWLASERPPYKLPLYWLSGRSGCGKSAALLHLAARLHELNPEHLILWLGEGVERVAEAVRWAAPHIKAQRRVVLLLDDPFTAARQQSFAQSIERAQAEWENIRAHGGAIDCDPPLILCCGPTEQRSAAEDICGSHIEVDGFDMPIESADDLEELARWYGLRTGQAVRPLSGNILLVQQLFEWTKGSIRDFAARFRDRIRRFDEDAPHGPVFETIAQILALNRLYVEFPEAVLEARARANPVLEAALIQLGQEEDHFAFGAGARGGVRLTHPHLADAIYAEWFGRPLDRGYRRSHLAQALGAALDQDNALPEIRHAALWSISRLAQPVDRFGRVRDPALMARIDLIRDELIEVLRDVYAVRWSSTTPIEDLPVWVGLNDELSLELSPDPAELLVAAIQQADAPCRGLRLSCHRLLASNGGDLEVIRAAVADCLVRFAEWRDQKGHWHEWAPLALDFLQRAEATPLLAVIAKLIARGAVMPRMAQLIHALLSRLPPADSRPIVLDWLRRTGSIEPGWSAILQRLLTQGHCSESDIIAQRFLHAARNDQAWAFIWRALLDGDRLDPATLIDMAGDWLGLNGGTRAKAFANNVGWDRVWQHLYALSSESPEARQLLVESGTEWIEMIDAGHEGWTHIWKALWESADLRTLRPDLLALAEIKLEAAPVALMGWSHVWTAALETAGAEDRSFLQAMGLVWLRDVDEQHLGWGFVWQALVGAASGAVRQGLIARGRQWLDRADPGHPSWAFIWLDLLAMRAEGTVAEHGSVADESVVRSGLDWLISVDPGQAGWQRVSQTILERGDAGTILALRQGLADWLTLHEGHGLWGLVLDTWRKTAPDREDRTRFASLCVELIERPDQNLVERGRLWRTARKLGAEKERLVTQAVMLLDSGWFDVDIRGSLCASALRMAGAGREKEIIRAHAQKLIDQVSAVSWPWLWEALARDEVAGASRELFADARQWLTEQGGAHREWSRVYLYASFREKALIDTPEIRAAAEHWLRTTVDWDKWTKIWRTLNARAELLSDPIIAGHARRILAERRHDRHWAQLWQDLHGASAEAARLGLRALAWDYLRATTAAGEWYPVWKTLFSMSLPGSEDRKNLLEAGGEALQRSPPIEGWSQLFADLKQTEGARLLTPELVPLVDTWLAGDDGRSYYTVVQWRSQLPPPIWDNPKLVARAERWLARTKAEHGAWSKIWTGLCRARPEADTARLQSIGLEWLAKVPGHAGWPQVWLLSWHLSRHGPENRGRLKALAIQWLRTRRDHHLTGRIAALVHGKARRPKR